MMHIIIVALLAFAAGLGTGAYLTARGYMALAAVEDAVAEVARRSAPW